MPNSLATFGLSWVVIKFLISLGFTHLISATSSGSWGLAIGSMGEGKYYVSFCGPGGCFKEGAYRPMTTLYNDPDYKVIDENTIEVRGTDGLSVYVRCQSRKDM